MHPGQTLYLAHTIPNGANAIHAAIRQVEFAAKQPNGKLTLRCPGFRFGISADPDDVHTTPHNAARRLRRVLADAIESHVTAIRRLKKARAAITATATPTWHVPEPPRPGRQKAKPGVPA